MVIQSELGLSYRARVESRNAAAILVPRFLPIEVLISTESEVKGRQILRSAEPLDDSARGFVLRVSLDFATLEYWSDDSIAAFLGVDLTDLDALQDELFDSFFDRG